MVTTHRYGLEGAAKHCNQHVDEYNDHDSTVCAEHEFSDELCEFMLLLQLEVVYVDQTIDGEVQRLNDLK